jgi:hypothetical protein
MRGAFILALTKSQRMALLDLISEHLRCPKENQTEEFIDCSTEPPTRTTAGDILRLISSSEWHEWHETPES